MTNELLPNFENNRNGTFLKRVITPIINWGLSAEAQKNKQQFENFPTSLPGAERVEKYYVKKSTHTLLHVAQMHEGNPDLEEISAEIKDSVRSIQKSVYEVCKFLKESGFAADFFLEGSYDQLTSVKNFYKRNAHPNSKGISTLCDDLDDLNIKKMILEPDDFNSKRWALVEELEKLIRVEGFSPDFYLGGVQILGHEEHVNCLPTESYPLLLSAFQKILSDSDSNELMAKRELFALVKIEEQLRERLLQTSFAPLIFGGGHNFTTAVKEFNKGVRLDSDYKRIQKDVSTSFSVIRIEPKGYADVSREIDN